MSEKREDDCPETLTATQSFQRLPETLTRHPFANSKQISAAPADDDEFEFAFVMEDAQTGHSITADEIFSDGKILPIYPVFNRDLLLSEAVAGDGGDEPERRPLLQLLIGDRSDSTSSSSPLFGNDMKGIPLGTYCLWNPDRSPAQSPSRVRKSGSTGSSLRWRIRHLMVRRSNSDGKEKFAFLAAGEKSSQGTEVAATGDEGKKKGKGKKAAEADLTTAYRMFYGRTAEKGGAAGRKSYQPYKPDIVGFFAGVNGLKRVHHPF